ncbi:16951_t:CDS:2 [Cetraspora pellucida]|uniref:16951_t:CDS:1 n=1 Tax=Cetraspora pellucida TaxID=1433469 RepID=A0A9N9C2Z4_9GLOM|nr:16951_t:CDS:2 [Cetraspora pellucida]
MMLKRSSSIPNWSTVLDFENNQPLRPGPLSSPIILPFEIGTTIVNPEDGSAFQLLQPLGNGSYAVVYRVLEKSSNKHYALKCLSKANLNDYHLEVQRNEVHVHKRLNHPNIVKLDRYFETPDWLFLVLEYCEGQDLYYWLAQNNDSRDPKTGKQLSEKERIVIVKQVFMQILDAVGYCHSQGVAHRDLKPENFIVMINNNSKVSSIQVKLTDFGLATDENESVDFDCGSKPYMSYECRNPICESYNPRLADIWSLGIILLNLMYHRSPWSDPNPTQCKSFASFQVDKSGFLINRFATIPKKVAHFLANRVFCKVEEGRIKIEEWKFWCSDMMENMLSERKDIKSVNDDAVVPQQQSSSSNLSFKQNPTHPHRCHVHNHHDSWSEVFGEFDNEMDFTAPVLFDRQDSDDYLKKLKDVKVETKNIVLQDELGLNKKDDENSADVNADNSDVDSGFGTDEDINNVIKKTQDVISESSEVANHYKVPLSVSPPKVIYCKPKPWGEQKSRDHQHEPSIENGLPPSSINNNHWSSYKQRRERLERRKHEQNLSMWNNRRRGSFSADDPTLASSRPHHISHFNHYIPTSISNSRPLIPKSTLPPSPFKSQLPPRKQKGSQLIYTPPISTSSPLSPLSTPSNTLTSRHKSSAVSSTSDQSSKKSLEITPMKVTRSTKNNLGKMLAGVVMFNRSVKVGGQDNGNI